MTARNCSSCNAEYDTQTRFKQPGKITVCSDCADEPVVKYTGNQIFADKTAPELQINSDPKLTAWIKRDGWGNPPHLKNGGCVTPPALSAHRRSHT